MIVSLVFEGEHIRRDIEVVITALTRNQVYRNVPRVRIPLSPPKTSRRQRASALFFIRGGFERVGSEWPADGRPEPTLTEPAGESESHPLRHKKSTAVLIELRWIFSMTENRLK